MKNLDNMKCTDDQIKKIGYIMIGAVLGITIEYAKRIALSGELKGIRKLITPEYIDFDDDMELLRHLEEPHIKLASKLIDYIGFELLERYALLNNLDIDKLKSDETAADMGNRFSWRYLNWRHHPRKMDRYLNFTKTMVYAQRTVYEWLKLMDQGQTRVFDPKYSSNYSESRLKALALAHRDENSMMMLNLIKKLQECEEESRTIPVRR